VILQHFCRQGLLDISDVLIKEANFPIEEDPRLSKAAFQQLNEIQEAFLRRDIVPALEWAIKHRYSGVHDSIESFIFTKVEGIYKRHHFKCSRPIFFTFYKQNNNKNVKKPSDCV
jgi:hypothetical protein